MHRAGVIPGSCTHGCGTLDLHLGTEALEEGLRKMTPARARLLGECKRNGSPTASSDLGRNAAALGTAFTDTPRVSAGVALSGLGSGCTSPFQPASSSHIPPFLFTTDNVPW